MQKVQRKWIDVAKELMERLQASNLSNVKLSKASHVNYYAIRRLRKSGVHNQSSNAEILCSYFKIQREFDLKVQSNEFDKLVSELAAAWDGSEPHAKLLTKLIRSTKSFRIEWRKDT